MADPFRLRVMKALSNCLKSITPSDGFVSDFSDYNDSAGRPAERVFRGRTVFGENDPQPMLSLLEDPKQSVPVNGATNSATVGNEFRVLVQGFVKDDPDHPLDPAYVCSADVVHALVKAKANRSDILGLGNRAPCVMGLSIGQPIHRPPDDEISTVAYFLVPVTLLLAENLETPFA